MAKKPPIKITTKKHLARQERERIQQRNITIASIAVLVAVFGIVLYGILEQTYLKGIQPVAIVNEEKILTRDFQTQTRYTRFQLVNNALNTFQLMQLLGSSPENQSSFLYQLSQIQAQLNPVTIGQQVIDQMIYDQLIRQEAARRGITVSSEEVEAALKEAFNFYPDGTPTPTATSPPILTSTLSPTQLELITPTSEPTATPVITITATPVITFTATPVITITATPIVTVTATPTEIPTETPTSEPSPTPTPFTLEGYQQLYKGTLDSLNENLDFSESDFRNLIETQLYSEKIKEAILAELKVTHQEEQVWARHILIEEEDTANDLVARIKDGEDWTTLAAEFSTDTSNKNRGGDLGWFGRGRMVSEFEQAAFDLQIGEIGQPVQTEFGWHIIQVLGHENRPLSDYEYRQLRDMKFQEWLDQLKENSSVEIKDNWFDRVPSEPALPPELVQFIQQNLNPPSLPTLEPTP